MKVNRRRCGDESRLGIRWVSTSVVVLSLLACSWQRSSVENQGQEDDVNPWSQCDIRS